MSTLASELRELRQAAGLSQRQFALRAQVSANYVAELERGSRGFTPSIELLERLAGAVDASPDVFRVYRQRVVCARWPDEVDKLYRRLSRG